MTLPVRALLLCLAWGTVLASPGTADEPRCHERPGAIGFAGTVTAFDVQAERGRLRIEEVRPGSPAAAAGLVAGDLILAIDDHALPPDRYEWQHLAGVRRVGDLVTYTVRRGEEILTLEATLAEPPEGWEQRYAERLGTLEMAERARGWSRLERLTAKGPVQIAFLRDSFCRFRAEVDGRLLSRPLTLAAALRVVPLLERLRPGHGLTLQVHVSRSALRIEPARLPSYLTKEDMARAIQQTLQRDHTRLE